ncbi:hyaluronidase-1-like [Clavelina lepadiformis]|uniref:hyaluronidase-1-like n=1 Tax=Clavelina lepadiformis TaxID=159417 RepID=UPI0040416813
MSMLGTNFCAVFFIAYVGSLPYSKCDELVIEKYLKPATATPILSPPLPQRPFLAVWNIDTSACKSKYNVEIDLSSFDIVNNPHETRDGDNMVIFYSSVFGVYPYIDDNGTAINGGIPQLGNISKHLEKCVEDIQKYIPDEDFKGLAVIDWESWMPLWQWIGWGTGLLYQNASKAKVKREHPDWSDAEILAQAKIEFESAAKSYFLATLNLATFMRPKASWGFYKLPDCYNYDKTGYNFTCRDDVMEANDKIQWLFDHSTALYPSTYLGIWFKNQTKAVDYTAYRVLEAQRVDNNIPGVAVPVYAYNNLVYRKTNEFLTLKDVIDSSGVAVVLGASGVVLWGDHMDNTKEKCEEVKAYVETILGPYLKLASDSAADCSLKRCNNHGRCVVVKSSISSNNVEIPSAMKAFLQITFLENMQYHVQCQCYEGFVGNSCENSDRWQKVTRPINEI